MTVGPEDHDPFDTRGIRERVLAGWRAAAVRFREDANAEEDLALGGYRDRLVVELAQNAADAALRAGVAGRLLLRLTELEGGPVLVAANTGAPLDAAGVEALATLRASAKRDDDPTATPTGGPARDAGTVGRFGVGFAAVLSVCDAPAVVSRRGGVRFSAADTRDLVEQVSDGAPGLAQEVTRRDGHVPVLRLPFPAEGTPPTGYDTAVVLPLRDAVAEDLVVRLLDEVGDPLLVALPGLAEVVVELPGRPPRVVADVADRWHLLRREGRFDDALLADRPTEERRRTAWTLTWAVPAAAADRADAMADTPAVLFAPTPSDEPLPWPAVLVATFPLDPSRRHVASGPATDALVVEAARAYADLLADRAAATGATPWRLVPTGLPAGVLDGALRAALADVLPGTAFLAAAEDPGLLLRPRDAVALDGAAGADEGVVAALAPTLAGLVHVPRAARAAAETVGLRRTGPADVVDQLPALADPGQWRALYAGLEPVVLDPAGREALGALPVPLADGRLVRGVRGALLPGGPSEVGAALGRLGVRAVHPDAVHPLLERLGAVPAVPRTALGLPEVRAAALAADDEAWSDDAEAPDAGGSVRTVEDAVLTLVAAAVADGDLRPGDLPWLRGLPLPDDEGERSPAASLALPGSPAVDLYDPDWLGLVAPAVLDRWGPDVLRAVGVLDGPPLLRAARVPLDADLTAFDLPDGGRPDDPGAADDPDDAARAVEDWADYVDGLRAEAPDATSAPDACLVDVVLVPDLDVVAEDRLGDLLRALAADPALRAAVTGPATVVGTGGSARVVPYTAWWLRRELGGVPWADPDAVGAVAALLPPAPPELDGLDPALRAALGTVRDVDGLDRGVVDAVLDRLADPALDLDAATALRLWPVLARLADGAGPRDVALPDVDPPDAVRVIDGAGTRLVDPDDAAVVGTPQHLQPGLLAAAGVRGAVVVAGPRSRREALADLLDVPVAEDVVDGVVDESDTAAGRPADVPDAVRMLLPDAPASWCEHDELLVDGTDVDWWVDGGGTVHACTLDGLARGLAWAAGAWPLRTAVAAVLEDPAALADVLSDTAFGRLADPGPEPDARR